MAAGEFYIDHDTATAGFDGLICILENINTLLRRTEDKIVPGISEAWQSSAAHNYQLIVQNIIDDAKAVIKDSKDICIAQRKIILDSAADEDNLDNDLSAIRSTITLSRKN